VNSTASIPPEKLPEPWLCDSQWLLNELAKARELALLIPYRNENFSAINTVVDRIFNLEKTIRFLLLTHAHRQADFAKRGAVLVALPARAKGEAKRQARKTLQPVISESRA
jgi:hypothetical protein